MAGFDDETPTLDDSAEQTHRAPVAGGNLRKEEPAHPVRDHLVDVGTGFLRMAGMKEAQRAAERAARGADGEISDNELKLELERLRLKDADNERRSKGVTWAGRYALIGLALVLAYLLFESGALDGLKVDAVSGQVEVNAKGQNKVTGEPVVIEGGAP